jgi:hypothetical protein
MPPAIPKIPIDEVTKDQLIRVIKRSGCKMLKEKLDGTETKAEIVEYLHACKCPVLRKLFAYK